MPHHADERAIEDEAVRAEIDRLTGLDLAELAVEIMSAFGMDRGRLVGSQGRTEQDVAAWLLRDYPTGGAFLPLLRSAVRRACFFLVQVGAAEYGDAGFGVAADGEVTCVTGLLQPTRWGASLLADGRLGKYVRACWVREHAVTAEPQELPGAEQRADWAQPAADWAQAAAWPQPVPDWIPAAEPDADWLPPLDWPADGADWTAGGPAPGYFASAQDWPGSGSDWAPAAPTWPTAPAADWPQPVLHGSQAEPDLPAAAADWSAPMPYLPRDADRLIVEHILPGRPGEASPGTQP